MGLFCFSSFIIVGFQLCLFCILAKIYAYKVNIINKLNRFYSWIMNVPTIRLVLFGLLFFVIGLVVSIISIASWHNVQFGNLNPNTFMPQVILANCCLIIGLQIFFSSFFISVMNIKR